MRKTSFASSDSRQEKQENVINTTLRNCVPQLSFFVRRSQKKSRCEQPAKLRHFKPQVKDAILFCVALNNPVYFMMRLRQSRLVSFNKYLIKWCKIEYTKIFAVRKKCWIHKNKNLNEHTSLCRFYLTQSSFFCF